MIPINSSQPNVFRAAIVAVAVIILLPPVAILIAAMPQYQADAVVVRPSSDKPIEPLNQVTSQVACLMRKRNCPGGRS